MQFNFILRWKTKTADKQKCVKRDVQRLYCQGTVHRANSHLTCALVLQQQSNQNTGLNAATSHCAIIKVIVLIEKNCQSSFARENWVPFASFT